MPSVWLDDEICETRICSLFWLQYAVLLRSLWKHFDVKSGSRVGGFLARSKALVMKKVAVRNLSMAFPKGEIFGLLGEFVVTVVQDEVFTVNVLQDPMEREKLLCCP